MVNSHNHHVTFARALCLAVMPLPAAALSPLPEPGITISSHAEHFHYREQDANGRQLNREKGYLQGIMLTAATEAGPLTAGLFASRTKGTVDYAGQTQAGRALDTDTREGITRYGFSLESPAWELPPITLTSYGTVGHTQWNRNILATDISSGLLEKYRWWHLAAGLEACLADTRAWCIRAGVTRTFSADMTIDLEFLGAGQPELALEPETGGEVALGWANERFSLQIYYREWQFGASDPALVRARGLLLEIMEPASKTRVTGLTGGFRF